MLLLLTSSIACNTREWDSSGINGEARLKIVNATSATAALVVDGKFEGTIAPYSSREFGVEDGELPINVGLSDTGQIFEFTKVRLRTYNRITLAVGR